jgi:hypothetical protein
MRIPEKIPEFVAARGSIPRKYEEKMKYVTKSGGLGVGSSNLPAPTIKSNT